MSYKPYKDPAEKLDTVFTFRINSTDKQLIEALAKNRGFKSAATLLQDYVRNLAKIARGSTSVVESVRQIKKVHNIEKKQAKE